MSNAKQETIADIVREMRYCAEKNSAWCCTTVEFEEFVDRIENTEFVEDLQNGVLRPTLNLCI